MIRRGFFANLQIYEEITLDVFAVHASWQVVTLCHEDFRKQSMSKFMVFDAKSPFSEAVTLSRIGFFPKYQDKYRI